ncbi:cyclic nucleotide-binding domain-containing protein [Chloropicon primus]|uniref:Cyclic nucleotide-binding domain-containing protein n=1 Tax=Chloropicon primus TaxID=1764295 RepID=A0A5B8MSE2_9CHLO|nr:hypothetical protein A3770_10p60570 [Chloropicon primus]UPR02751.1 cyclic nucleotide-binding domain-containing protein [Chloropicon primus]|eukprot:QDZ23539.1 hypothetical protein A3770_10p60570 [Chloropicon primus]
MALEMLAFGQTKVNQLRLFAMVAALLIMTYTLIVTDGDVFDCHAIWSFLHFSLNAYKLIQGYATLWIQMRKLKPWDITCREWYFNSFTDQEFLALREYWEWVLLEEGDVLVEEGEEVEYMSMIFQGQGEIRIDGKQSVLAQIGPGSWVGEMAFFTGELASATVCAAKPTLIIRWEIDQIKKLLQLPGRSYKAQAFAKLPSHFCADLARKVKQYNSIPAMQSFIQSQKEQTKHTKLKKFDNKKGREQPMKAGFVSLVSVRRSWVNFFDKEKAEAALEEGDLENGQPKKKKTVVRNLGKVHPDEDKPVSGFGAPRKPKNFYRQDTTSRLRRQRVQSVSLGIPQDPVEEGDEVDADEVEQNDEKES